MRVVPFLVVAVVGASLIVPLPSRAQEAVKTPPAAAVHPTESSANAPREAPRIESRVRVGEMAPDFELDGSRGSPVRITRLRGYRVLLAFGDTRADLSPLRASMTPLDQLGTRVVGVCGEKSRTLEQAAARDPAGPLLLADVTGEVAAIYGLYDSERRAIRPGYVLVDRDGTVRMALLGQSLPSEDLVRLVHFAVEGF